MAQCVMTVFGIIRMHLWFADSLDSHLMVNSNGCACTFSKAVGTGPAARRPPDQYSANQPMQKCRMSFGGLFNSCSKSSYAREISEDRCYPQDFCWGAEASTFCRLKKVPVEAFIVWENDCELLSIDREHACHYGDYGGEDNKECRQ